MSRANEPAYPVTHDPSGNTHYGLTIREHFAALAMQGLLASNAKEAHADYEWLVNRAVTCAEMLLAELERKP